MRSRNVPALRLEGFDGEWETTTLGELGSTYGGLTGKKKDDFGHGDAMYITYKDIFSRPLITDTTQCDYVEIDTSQNEVRYGDVFFTTSSEVPEEVGLSAVWLVDKPNIYLNSFCFGFRPTGDLDLLFLGYVLRSPAVRSQFLLLAQGISRFNISKTKAANTSLYCPPTLEEQQAIGAIFTNLDAAINQHTKKHQALQQAKTALMQRMFPQEGQTVPELRLEGFDGEWEETAMSNIATFSKGTGYSKIDFRASGTPLFHYGRLYTNYQLAVTAVDTFAQMRPGSTLSRGNEVLIPSSGETAEDIAIACALLQVGVILGRVS